MTQSTKVTRRIDGAMKPYYVAVLPDRKGSYRQFTQQEVESSTGKYEICESATARQVFKEFTPLDEGWTRGRFSEDAAQELLATQHSLTARGFAQDGSNWKRGAVSVLVGADGSWRCGKDMGKTHSTLESTLDSKYPQESFRDSSYAERLKRMKLGFSALGLSPEEAELAARGPMQNGTDIDVQLRGKALLDLLEPE